MSSEEIESSEEVESEEEIEDWERFLNELKDYEFPTTEEDWEEKFDSFEAYHSDLYENNIYSNALSQHVSRYVDWCFENNEIFYSALYSKTFIWEDVLRYLGRVVQNKIDSNDYGKALKIYAELDNIVDKNEDDGLWELDEGYRFPKGSSKIHLAVFFNNLQKLKAILQKNPGCLFNTTKNGKTALHFAASYGYTDIAKYLISVAKKEYPKRLQKFLNIKNKKNKAAIFYAIDNEHIDVLRTFAEQPAISFFLSRFETVFHYIIKNYSESKNSLLRTLIIIDSQRKWAIINYSDGFEKTALHNACESKLTNAALILLEHPFIKVDHRDDEENTPINYAIANGLDLVLASINQHFDPNNTVQDSGKRKTLNTLQNELREGLYGEELDWLPDDERGGPEIFMQEEITKTLAELEYEELYEADIEKNTSIEGQTYLHQAIRTGNYKIIIEVLKFLGLNIETRDTQEDLRAITLAKQSYQTNSSREERALLKRFENIISVNLRRRDQQGLKKQLCNYGLEDLKKLLLLSSITLLGKTLLEGYVNFDVHIVVDRKKKKKEIITPSIFLKILNEIIQEKSAQPPISLHFQFITDELFIYIILRSAHALFNDANVTSGEELDEEEEKEITNKRKLIWQELSTISKTLDDEKDLDKSLIPIFRGINFKMDLFEYEDRTKYESQSQQKNFFASHACYGILGRQPFELTTSDQELKTAAEEIIELIEKLGDKSTVELFSTNMNALRCCDSLLTRLHLFYTENTNGFNFNFFENLTKQDEEIKAKIRARFPWFEKLFEHNPFVSGSIIPMHSIRYALGLSRAPANTALLLDPRYDFYGKPKYACVGVVFIALYPKADYLKLAAINIPKAFAEDKFMLKGYKTLLPEAEVTISGMMENVEISLPIIFPSFEKENKAETLNVFGLTERKYNKISEGITSKRGTENYRRAIQKLKIHLVEFYNEKLFQIAQGYARKKGAKLEFELPSGEFTTIFPKPVEIRDMAEKLRKERAEVKSSSSSSDNMEVEEVELESLKALQSHGLFSQSQKRERDLESDTHPKKRQRIDTSTNKNLNSANTLQKKLHQSCENWLLKKTIELSILESRERLKIQLTHEANSFGFRCQDVPGDGNCFFHVVLNQLKRINHSDNQLSEESIREKSVNFIIEHIHKFCEFLDEEPDDFIDKISQSGEWADHPLIIACAYVLNINILILRSDGADPIIIKLPKATDTICLGYEVGLHYQSLERDETIVHTKNIKQFFTDAEVNTLLEGASFTYSKLH
jgi:ankyrin repeat protein